MSINSFRILDPSAAEQFSEWVAVWSRTSHREVQAHPSYGMALTPSADRFLGAVGVFERGTVILPFVVRDLPIETASHAQDAITPYGYGGAYRDGEGDADWFWGCWDNWATGARVAGITIRSHLFSEEVLPVTGPCVHPLANVVVDLGQTTEQIWTGYEGRVRTDIRRGRRLGVKVTVDERCDYLAAWHRLYSATMNAKGADTYYSFDLPRLERMVTSLGPSVVLFHAHVEDRLVASEMQLLGARNAYYFLSGCNEEGRRTRANPVMKHDVITWLKTRGIRRYVLGGGMKRDDSLFRYKRAYAPRSITEFAVTFHEAQPGEATRLVEARMREDPGWRPADGFVPEYRAPTAKVERAR